MKRFITLFLVMNFYATTWGMNNTGGEYKYSQVERRNLFQTEEKVDIVVSYSVKQHPNKNKNKTLFRVGSEKSYPDGSSSNRSFEWEEPGNISDFDVYKQHDLVSRKLGQTTREDDKKNLKVVLDNVLIPQFKPFMSREDLFRVLEQARREKFLREKPPKYDSDSD